MRSSGMLLVCAVLCSACFDPPPPIIEEPDVSDASDTVAGDTAEEVSEEVVTSLCVTDCNDHGVCDESTGLCACSAAWTGKNSPNTHPLGTYGMFSSGPWSFQRER